MPSCPPHLPTSQRTSTELAVFLPPFHLPTSQLNPAELTVFYGPDTYMGENLRVLFKTVSEMPDKQIKALHPDHDQASVRSLLERLEVFQQGMCVVHHMFGDSVVEEVEAHYPDAMISAHLEVPGGMFELANKAAVEGRGVVGSTANILNFIITRTKEAVAVGKEDKLQFVLGTEAGMVTPIVKSVQVRPLSMSVEYVGRCHASVHIRPRAALTYHPTTASPPTHQYHLHHLHHPHHPHHPHHSTYHPNSGSSKARTRLRSRSSSLWPRRPFMRRVNPLRMASPSCPGSPAVRDAPSQGVAPRAPS